MDISPRDPSDLERGSQPDVMEIAVDPAQPTSIAQADQASSPAPNDALPPPHIVLSPPPHSDEADLFTPLLLGKKGKTPARVSLHCAEALY